MPEVQWDKHVYGIQCDAKSACIPVFPLLVPIVPTSAPVNVCAITTGSTAIHLQWSPPPTNTINGVPLDYVISYTLANSGNSPSRVTTGDTRTRYEFTNLEPYTEYSFRVAVRNSIGTGPYSHTVSNVTATDGTCVLRILKIVWF